MQQLPVSFAFPVRRYSALAQRVNNAPRELAEEEAREQAAMEEYPDLAAETPPGAIRDLFTWRAEEELAHKAELEKQYYQLVCATNV